MEKTFGLVGQRAGRALFGVGVVIAGCGVELDTPLVEAQTLALSLPALSRDDAFGDHGAKFVPASAGLAVANAVAVQNGATIAVGNPGNREAFAISRFLPDGRLDSMFRGGTISDLFPSGNSEATEVAYQPDGKVVVAGHSSDAQAHHCYAAVRLLQSGAPDLTFGPPQRPLDTDPNLRVAPGVRVCFGGEAWVQAMALQPDGKVLLAGFARPTISDGLSAGLVRLTSSGVLDSSFHGNGIAQRGNPGLIAEALALQSDGSVLVAGHLGDDFAVERYRADGTFDRSFNRQRGVSVIKYVTPQGVQSPVSATQAIASNAPLQSRVIALGVDAQDRVVLAGHAHGYFGFEYNFGALSRLDAAGVLDQTFGRGGRILTLVLREPGTESAPAEPARFAELSALSLTSTGAVLAVGSYEPLLGAADFAPVLLRYDANGVLQERRLETFSPAGSSLRPLALAAAPSASSSTLVTIAGMARSNGTSGSGLMRFRNGRLFVLSPSLAGEP